MCPVPRLASLRGREFRLLWAGRTASELGNALVPVALAFAVLDLTSSATSLGLVLVAAFIPRVVLLLLGGVVADRWPRRWVMLATDVVRASTQGLVAFVLLSGQARLWHLALLFAAYGAADAFFSPASTGLRARGRAGRTAAGGECAAELLAKRHDRGRTGAGGTAGRTVRAGDRVRGGRGHVRRLCALAGPSPRSPVTGRNAGETSVASDLRVGWHEVTARSWVWTSIAFFSISNLAIAPLFVLGPVVAQGSLGGPGAWGLILSAAGAGSLVGDTVALVARPRRTLVPGYLALASCGLAPALLARPFPTAFVAVASAVGFAALSFSNAVWSTALQDRIPRQSLSRVSAYDWLGSRLFQPLGYALAGPAGAAIGIPATLLAGAALQASASVVVALVPAVRKL